MSLGAALKVPKFKSDRTVCILQLSKIEKVLSGDNVSRGSRVLIKYESLTLEANIIGVDGKCICLSISRVPFRQQHMSSSHS